MSDISPPLFLLPADTRSLKWKQESWDALTALMQAWGAKIRSDLMDKAIPICDQSMHLSIFCPALKIWDSSIKSVKAAQEFLNDAIVNSVALGQEDVFIPEAVNCEIEDSIISYPFLAIGNLFNTTWKIEKCNGHFVIGESVAVDTYKFKLDVAALLVPEQDHWKSVPVTRNSTGKPIPVAVTTKPVPISTKNPLSKSSFSIFEEEDDVEDTAETEASQDLLLVGQRDNSPPPKSSTPKSFREAVNVGYTAIDDILMNNRSDYISDRDLAWFLTQYQKKAKMHLNQQVTTVQQKMISESKKHIDTWTLKVETVGQSYLNKLNSAEKYLQTKTDDLVKFQKELDKNLNRDSEIISAINAHSDHIAADLESALANIDEGYAMKCDDLTAAFEDISATTLASIDKTFSSSDTVQVLNSRIDSLESQVQSLLATLQSNQSQDTSSRTAPPDKSSTIAPPHFPPQSEHISYTDLTDGVPYHPLPFGSYVQCVFKGKQHSDCFVQNCREGNV